MWSRIALASAFQIAAVRGSSPCKLHSYNGATAQKGIVQSHMGSVTKGAPIKGASVAVRIDRGGKDE